ncbi:MAG: hypothetical protein IPP90_19535 [Gemmatimonadaceae bacterium]|nr:hypothetical protein [Gemmatimonadaceae bacterium]
MNAPTDVRVYVNERGVSVPIGSHALDAVRALFPDQAEAIGAGVSRLTDSRGLPVPHDTRLTGGAIFRVVPVRDRTEDGA